MRARAMLATAATVILAALIASACSSIPQANSASTSAATRSAAPSISVAPTLSAAETRFVNYIRQNLAAHGSSNPASDQQIASLGEQTCRALKAGATQAELISASKRIPGKFSLTGRQFVRLAERDLCRSYLPHVVARFTGSGIENTPSFITPAQWQLVWSYSGCPGGTGNFIVDEYNTDGSPDFTGASVNELGSGRSHVTTYVYGDAGSHYVSINSECAWAVKVVSG